MIKKKNLQTPADNNDNKITRMITKIIQTLKCTSSYS